jgi:peroxiredoxin
VTGLFARLATCVLFSLAVAGCGSTPPVADLPPVGTDAGFRAPELEGEEAGGRPFSLDVDGQANVVLFYLGARCGFCRERLAALEAHIGEYERLGARVVAVSIDGREETSRLGDELGLSFALVSVESSVLDAWEVPAGEDDLSRPATFVLDDRGVIRHRHVGASSADRLSDPELLRIVENVVRGGSAP